MTSRIEKFHKGGNGHVALDWEADDLDSLRRALKKSYQDLSGVIGPPYPDFPGIFRRLINNYARESTEFAAVSAVSNASCSVPWILEKRVGTAWVEVKDHADPVWSILAQPNEAMGWREWVRLTFQFLETCGNGIFQITAAGQINAPGLPGAREKRTASRSLIPLWPHMVKIEFDAQRGPTKYQYSDGHGRSVEFDPSEVVHFQYRSPVNMIYGFPPSLPSEPDAKMVFSSTDWNNKFFSNGAVPPFGVETPYAASEAQRLVWLARWRAKTQRGNWQEPFLFDVGEKVVPIGNKREVDFSEGVKSARMKILASHGVPPAIAGFEVGGYGSFREQMKQFWTLKMLPTMMVFSDQINSQLIPDGYRFRFDFADVLPLVKEHRENVEADVRMIGTGVKTINESREEQGYPPVPWGDSPPPAFGSQFPQESKPAPQEARSMAQFAEFEHEPGGKFVKIHGCRFLAKHASRHLGSIELCKRERGRDIPKLKAVVKAYLKGLADRIAEAVRSGKVGDIKKADDPQADALGGKLVDPDQEALANSGTVAKELARIMARHANLASVGAGLGISFGVTDPYFVDAARDSAGDMIRNVTDTVRAGVGRQVADAIKAGTPRSELADTLEKWVDDEDRAERIADTETLAAVQSGRQRAYEEGGVYAKRWVPIVDESTRQPTSKWTKGGKYGYMTEDHAIMADDLSRALKRVDEPFEVPGRDNDRTPMMHPGDGDAPADVVVNCVADPSTPVLLADGSTKPISAIRPGDRVVSAEGNARRVLRTKLGRPYRGRIVRVEFADRILKLTPNHRLYTTEGPVRADRLHVGSKLLLVAPSRIELMDTVIDRVLQEEFSGLVYNFAVEGDASYVIAGVGSKNCRCISEVVFEDEYRALVEEGS